MILQAASTVSIAMAAPVTGNKIALNIRVDGMGRCHGKLNGKIFSTPGHLSYNKIRVGGKRLNSRSHCSPLQSHSPPGNHEIIQDYIQPVSYQIKKQGKAWFPLRPPEWGLNTAYSTFIL